MDPLSNGSSIETQATALAGLNPRQSEAALHRGSPLLIVAGAGSGKTRVIAHRIAHLLRADRVPPWRILGLTFTNKAAGEMRDRVASLAGEFAVGVVLKTFHSFALSILRVEGEHLGYRPNFTIFDEDDSLRVVRDALREARFSVPDASPEKIRGILSRAKNLCIDPEDASPNYVAWAHLLPGIAAMYERRLFDQNAVDYDNLLLKCVELFDKSPEIRDKYRMRFRHILVDEYQDTNRAQYLLLRHLVGPDTEVTVVGDSDQSIYGWRGADFQNIYSFHEDFPDVRTIMLEQNYRSTQNILDAANALIKTAPGWSGKRLWSEMGKGEKVGWYRALDERDEASFVADEVDRLLTEEDYRPGGVAVLFRTRAQSRALEETFMRRNIPYVLVGTVSFFDRREVKDLLAYLRFISNPEDRVSFARIANTPRRGIGPVTMETAFQKASEIGGTLFDLAADPGGGLPKKMIPLMNTLAALRALAAEGMAPGEFVRRALEDSGYEAYLKTLDDEEAETRLDNARELASVAAEFAEKHPGASMTDFLADITLLTGVDEADFEYGAVRLMTLHNAKGLEFPVVFIVGLEDNLLPHRNSMEDPARLAEERRLCYVGFTRAREILYLTSANARLQFGRATSNPPSMFLRQLPDDAMRVISHSAGAGRSGFFDEEPAAAAAPAARVAPREIEEPASDYLTRDIDGIRAGDAVRHREFGVGRVVSLKTDQIGILFNGHGLKMLDSRYAKLTRA